MKTKHIVLTAVLGATLIQLGAIVQYVQAKNDPAKRIKVQPAVEVLNKYNSVAMAPVCPRTTISHEDPVVRQSIESTDSEYVHCQECGMGVYFKKEELLECSYCNHKRSI